MPQQSHCDTIDYAGKCTVPKLYFLIYQEWPVGSSKKINDRKMRMNV